MDKKSLRKQMLAKRADITHLERKRAEILINEKLFGHLWFYKASNILLYVSYGSEISTIELLKEVFRLNKKVYVPKVIGKEMRFFRIHSLEDLCKGYKGILEPMDEAEEFQAIPEREEDTLMIMPGVAFDCFRNRLGYGGGYYDRYLSDKPFLHTIAIGFACQMTDELEPEEGDIRPGQIICM